MTDEVDSPEYAETQEDYFRLMKIVREKEEREYAEYSNTQGYFEDLIATCRSYVATESFEEGDLVQWKPRMKNQRFPQEGKPAVVLKRLQPPYSKGPDGENLIESQDLLLGFLDGDGNLRVFPYTSNRLTAWRPSSQAIPQ